MFRAFLTLIATLVLVLAMSLIAQGEEQASVRDVIRSEFGPLM